MSPIAGREKQVEEDQFPLHLRAPFPILGRKMVAVSDHPVASRTAARIVESGGNAVDAAVALSVMLGCCCPYYTGLGGGGFALVWMPGWERPRWLDFRECAPAAAHPEVYLELPEGSAYEGPRSVGVPGNLAGLWELHRNFGRLPWSNLLEPTIRRAQSGIKMDANWYRISLAKEAFLQRHPAMRELFLPGGSVPFPGTRVYFPELARTLRLLAEQGPDAFYRGTLTPALVQACQGWLTADDLDAYRPCWREPLAMDWDGGRLFSVGAPSAGGLQLFQILGLMERQDRSEDNFYHALVEAMRVCFRERGQSVGDPGFGAPPLDRFLTPEWFDGWAGRLSREQILALSGPTVSYAGGGTASHAVATQDGGLVIITESINHWFGSMVVAPGTGLVLNNTMDDFSTHPSRPDHFGLAPSALNQVQAGKRPVSSSSPCILMKDGLPLLAAGSAGGPRITTSVAQILLQRRWRSHNIQQAVSAPRIHHQWYPDHVEVEPLIPETIRAGLRRRGHDVQERYCRSHAAALECHWGDGFFSAGSDYRSFGGAWAL